MNKFQHPTNNSVLGAPPGVSIEQCTALPITRIQYQDGTNACISFWKPSVAELEKLNQGWAVAIELLGVTHPPLAVTVSDEKELTLLE